MKGIAITLSIASCLLNGIALFEARSRFTVFLVWPKFVANAWAAYLALAGALGAGLGLFAGSVVAVVVGLAGSLLGIDYVRRVTAPPDGFARAFGADWQRRLGRDDERRMVQRRWSWRVPAAPEPRLTCDLAFASIPGSDRQLLCDVWQPPKGVTPSGTAIIYLHGSAWYLVDKDVATRPFFRHLAAQGHVVMDVAYRLCPETNAIGMVGDAKRAVAWMKAHAADYGVRPEQVVLMGASAGGHIVLLAAYTPGHPRLTPDELRGVDTSVRAVVSYYGVPDLREYEAQARRFVPPGTLPITPPRLRLGRLGRFMSRLAFGRVLKPEQLPPLPTHPQMMRDLVGGLPDEVPEMYDLASPTHHVTATSPPTLHFQGLHDQIVPPASARRLRDALVAAGVPAIFIEYPRTGHAFDLVIRPLEAPAGQAALYDLERFLACLTLDRYRASAGGEAPQPRQAPTRVEQVRA